MDLPRWLDPELYLDRLRLILLRRKERRRAIVEEREQAEQERKAVEEDEEAKVAFAGFIYASADAASAARTPLGGEIQGGMEAMLEDRAARMRAPSTHATAEAKLQQARRLSTTGLFLILLLLLIMLLLMLRR